MNFSYNLKVKHHKVFFYNEGSFQKKILVWQAKNIKDFAKSFSGKLIRNFKKVQNFLNWLESWMLRELLYFLEICSYSGKSIE